MSKQMFQTVVYISGPMQGFEDFNYPAFNEASAALRGRGFAVLNPASNFEGDCTLNRETYMRHDFFHVLQADQVWVLPGWRKSTGARAEVLMAQQMGVPVMEFATNMPVRLTVETNVVPWQT